MRIVSLLPSATESLLAITGRADCPGAALVGRSHECDFPLGAGLEDVPVLTAARTAFESSAQIDRAVSAQLADGQSLYTLNVELLAQLKPDLIITQDLCRVCSIDLNAVRVAAARLSSHPEILSLNPTTIEGVLDDVLEIGRATGLFDVAAARVAALRERLYRAEEFVTPFAAAPTVVFLEWTDPLFVGGHWTPQLIERAGGLHPLNPTAAPESAGAAAGPIGQTLRAAGPSIRIPAEVVAAIRPDRVIVCPCGLSLEDAWRETQLLSRHAWWRDLPAVRAGRVAVVDGNQMFNRPGPRLVDAFEWLVGWLNDRPGTIPAEFPWRTLA
ncbi:MAG: ABC transporter substrate-binding protein [Phycisphaeraceae bacterium]|nr:ABC transporter substrate-binding protein [Phycisphaeraceae bacterium]MBX3406874.1 ABC transporter substrate-binding protein [Phycisphaeraceae bacterium]